MPHTRKATPELERSSTHGSYQNCYVAFLDVLGFRQLVDRSADDAALLQRLSGITGMAAKPQSGIKETSLGPCPMQVRAFSDSFVVFTPVVKTAGDTVNRLAQLCFVVRYLHDRMLEMGACIRGGIVEGKMFWRPSWSDTSPRPTGGLQDEPAITFGPGLNAAYDLESKQAIYPRVLVAHALADKLRGDGTSAYPFASHGTSLHDSIRADADDQMMHLDLLNARVVRHQGEAMRSSHGGFTVTWDTAAESAHHSIIDCVKKVAAQGMKADKARGAVWQKYAWLATYCKACSA